MKPPKMIEMTQDQIDDLLKRIKTVLQPGDYDVIAAVFNSLAYLKQAYHSKTASIQRLVRMIFGPRTEKTKTIIKDKDVPADDQHHDLAAGEGNGDPGGKTGKPDDEPEKKRKGHGRNSAKDYSGAEKKDVFHPHLNSGDGCPHCNGKVYKMQEPGQVIRFFGQAPVGATVWQLEKFRCNLCGQVYTPDLPEQAKGPKYDPTAVAAIAVSRYGFGFPFYRLENYQRCVGVPLAASTQWDLVNGFADQFIDVFTQMKHEAAQGDLIHNDDTTMKILELMKINQDPEHKPTRTGMFTTGILSIKANLKIAIFNTGRNHAGENLSDLLEKRDTAENPPIQMCDALSRNAPKTFKTLLANCNAHARRNFVNVAQIFTEKCSHVLDVFKKIYTHDDEAKIHDMSDQQRLEYHQTHSGPVMERFHSWLKNQFDEKEVEPNSGLGQAINYMLKHWERLTLFLHVAGVPLDNNICERVLKMAIKHRKNSLFYKTLRGATVGDMFMSFIHTCILNGVNPFDYIVSLQRYSSDVSQRPGQWMPWNYKSTISDLAPP
jgi:transposase